ncbi:MAG: hypothetical protein Q7U57_14010 [Methylovulum sp.]|nr:hypothetical protein [Methylovulum sp.]
MKKYIAVAAFGLLMMTAKIGTANTFELPVRLDYSLIKKAVTTQLYTGTNQSAELWNDKHGCSFLTLSNLKISGQKGQIQLLNDVQAQFGTQFGGQCITVLKWGGILETWQQPTLSADHKILSLPVTKAIAYDRQGRQLAIDKLRELLQRVAEPKLAAVKIDLHESRGDMERTVTQFLPEENLADIKAMLDSLVFSSASAGDDGVAILLSFDAPIKAVTQQPSPAFSAAEQQQWQAAWQQWDTFLSNAIQQASDDTQSQELRDTLTEILLESRSAFQAGLKEHDTKGEDPVRSFFMTTWERLAPQLHTLAKQLPEVQSLRYMTFIAATDIIYQLETLGAPFGIEISSDGLRRLARILIAGQQEQATAKGSSLKP